jgi:chromate transporter
LTSLDNTESIRKYDRMQGNQIPWPSFLKDVFICSLGAYGGPEAHFSVFLDQMVSKRKYLSETELVELFSLCSILPGPTSTQAIVSMGIKAGGPVLALLTFFVWALPVMAVMGALSFLYQFLEAREISFDLLRFIDPMAVGFIIVAAFRIGRKVVTNKTTAILMACAALVTYFIRAPWIFPALLLCGGLVTILLAKEKDIWNKVPLSPPWGYLALFVAFAIGGLALAGLTPNRLAQLFENFYRYGYLVFGGGQVVVPVMHSELVQVRAYMSSQEFLTGYGLVQGLPGPMFSFATYAGGMAARDGTSLHQVLGAAIGGISIFLPGILLIYFVYPIWEALKQVRAIRLSLQGIAAVAGGLIAVAALILTRASGLTPVNLLATGLSVLLLATRKIPAPLIVLAALAAGVLF